MPTIDITEITAGTLSGTGVFDKLMAAVTAHLDDQYTKGRIKGAEYATVYLGAVQSAMQQSVSFVLGEQQAELALTQLNDTLITNAKQREEINSRVVLLDTQIQEQLDGTARANTQLTDALTTSLKQRVQMDSQIDLLHVQMAEAVDGTTRANVQLNDGLDTSAKQRNQIDSGVALQNAQSAEQTAATIRQGLESTQDVLVKTAQTAKLTSEKGILDNKALTELQQAVLIQKQQDLYIAQKDGFARDAEMKAAKLASELWQISKGTLPTTYDLANVMTEAQIGNAVKNAVTGAGLSYTSTTP
jgi:hypothetical protein